MGVLSGIKSIEDFKLKDQKVFMRLDLNVPIKEGKITDDKRIQAALPTIRYALDKGAQLVLASHMGRPQTEEDRKKLSLEPVGTCLGEWLEREVVLVEDPASDAPKALLSGALSGQVILLENLRFDSDETKNNQGLARTISEYTDIYINDAFGACHRAHASIVGVAAEVKEKGIGFLMKKEIEMLDKILHSAEAPFVALLGGAKVSDKILVIENLIDQVDSFIIGGAMAYTFLQAQGIEVGASLVEKDKLHFCKKIIERIEARNKKILLPIDHIVVPDKIAVDKITTTSGVTIKEDLMGVDIGPKTSTLYVNEINLAKTVFWNGPMGVFETPELSQGTFDVAHAVAHNTGFTVVGGGDSAAAAKASGQAEKISHISTGGGASLEYLQGCKLPGIEVLRS